ncbi:type II toxin-antitoxin system HicB family antitoxin [Nodularia sp. UHCC 0506]|uniref:type II toxin-antitoxin system HicB family antitoxin n=1 Tax=Nodularia sp. UHCC 0506 TaxID=3110243 RepID=UPI002B1FD628|nr:type II toxin-antitoxin system HicB family antitoxin [Nodularia sp. UHCC 0506]MEA5515882.1 type II toxin-antitoxin system HicB family antitoxin [Nodularia sp. UHCC 0506]
MMKYKGYEAIVEFDDEAEIFHGEIVNIRDVVTFQGDNVKDLKQAFEDSIEDYLDFCRERGEEPEKPFSGKFVVRIKPELHKEISIKARKEGKSLNSLVENALQQFARLTEV